MPSDPGKAVLSADLTWGTELDWDFAYVQVFDPAKKNGSASRTVREHDEPAQRLGCCQRRGEPAGPQRPSPNPDGDPATVADQQSGTETFDLSAYAGQTIDVAFRYITDPATTGDGYWVDNVKVGDTVVSTGDDLSAWKSLTQARPVPVAGWTVQLVGYGNGEVAYVGSVPLRYNANRDALDRGRRRHRHQRPGRQQGRDDDRGGPRHRGRPDRDGDVVPDVHADGQRHHPARRELIRRAGTSTA